MRPAKRRSPVPTAIPWCRVCARTGTGRSFLSTARRTLRAWSSGWRNPATSSCVSAPATSPNGPMRCRASSPRWGRWRDDRGQYARCARVAMIFPDLVAELAFCRGIPGAVGGALRMNGGAYGRETKDALIEARGVDRGGRLRVFSNGDMHYSYRHCGAPDDIVFTQALFQGAPGDPAAIAAEMEKITESREATQPIKSRTGGSTFKNPPGHKAWQLIDAAGCRGLKVGDAQVSEMHCNFLINLGSATAADIETLGETVRRRVKENSGVELEWEIKRIGVA